MKKSIALFILLIACVAFNTEARTIRELFIEEPGHVLPLINDKVKMDMIDYHNEGIKKVFPNVLGHGTELIAVTDNYISVTSTASTSVELLLITQKTDSVIIAITTVALPAKDSRIELYNTSWEKLNLKLNTPTMKDFISIPKGDKTKKETVLQSIDLPIISYSINPDNGTITARHSLKEYLSKDEYEKIAPYLRDSIEIPIKIKK